jgi:predicted dehydrogenase
MMAQPKRVRWGMMGKSMNPDIPAGAHIDILAATGGIVRTFTKDILMDPKTRGVEDIIHVVTAAASSSSKKSDEEFVADVVTPRQSEPRCSAYGSYEELVKDPNVDIIYIGTPQSHHFQNCMLALEHNKPVLCEKALIVNAKQAKKLFGEARRREVFLMEAIWTRYFPLSIAVREKIRNGHIGEVLRVSADLSIGEIPEEFDEGHRMVNKELAGGALMDLGGYALTWVFQTAYHTLEKREEEGA